jgi:hypothetical protein
MNFLRNSNLVTCLVESDSAFEFVNHFRAMCSTELEGSPNIVRCCWQKILAKWFTLVWSTSYWRYPAMTWQPDVFSLLLGKRTFQEILLLNPSSFRESFALQHGDVSWNSLPSTLVRRSAKLLTLSIGKCKTHRLHNIFYLKQLWYQNGLGASWLKVQFRKNCIGIFFENMWLS